MSRLTTTAFLVSANLCFWVSITRTMDDQLTVIWNDVLSLRLKKRFQPVTLSCFLRAQPCSLLMTTSQQLLHHPS